MRIRMVCGGALVFSAACSDAHQRTPSLEGSLVERARSIDELCTELASCFPSENQTGASTCVLPSSPSNPMVWDRTGKRDNCFRALYRSYGNTIVDLVECYAAGNGRIAECLDEHACEATQCEDVARGVEIECAQVGSFALQVIDWNNCPSDPESRDVYSHE